MEREQIKSSADRSLLVDRYKNEVSEWSGELTATYFEDSAQQVALITKSEGQGLDIGAGRGTLSIMLAKRGLAMTAVDLVPEMSELTQKNSEAEGVAGLVDTRTCDFFESEFPTEFYDVIKLSRYSNL